MFVLPKYTWDKDRELCKKCKHYREQPDASGYNGGGSAPMDDPWAAPVASEEPPF